MLTPRNVILASLTVVLLWLAWAVVSLLREPDSEGRAADSYGTRDDGQRGLYETMAELGLPVSRSLAPPHRSLPLDVILVVWAPRGDLVRFEPRHLQELGKWVAAGGCAVVTPPRESPLAELMPLDVVPSQDAATTLWEALGLNTTTISSALAPVPAAAPPGKARRTGHRPDEAAACRTVRIDAAGTLAEVAAGIAQLAVPEDGVQFVSAPDAAAGGELTFTDTTGASRALVREFPVKRGRIVIVADPRLFSNRLLGYADNSVLAVRLLLRGGGRVQFDEFYHGLSVRGNPLWLLTRRGYAVLAVAILAVIGVTTWREAVLLGPPLNAPEPSRRTVAEYIDAMARFLNRGRRTRSHLLQTVYAGVLRRLAVEHGLSQRREELDVVAAAVGRRDPEREQRLRAAAEAVDAVLAKHDKASEKDTVRAAQMLKACL